MTRPDVLPHDDAGDDQVLPHHLRTEDDSSLVASAHPAPRLSWRLSASRCGVRQRAYQIEVADDAGFGANVITADTVWTSSPMFAPWPAAPLQSRERRWWRVRVLTDCGWTRWSEACPIEGSLFRRTDWIARPISPRSNAGRVDRSPACLLRREFDVSNCISARLYVTALGVHDVRINGRAVSGDLLEPGWTDYRHRTLFSAYDVLPLLREGRNCIAAELADGWWRGELGWLERRGIYGDTTAFLAQLEVLTASGEQFVVATDADWRGSYGATRLAELYDGDDIDWREEPAGWRDVGFDDRAWEEVIILDLPPGLEQRAMPAVRVLDSYEPRKVERVENRIHVDAEQNLVGFLRIHARGPRGREVNVRHAEVLEADGALHRAPLRNARAADNYILRGDGVELLEPKFTFHGFRHAEVHVGPGVDILRIEIVWIGSDLVYSGRFRCSNDDLNKLFDNAVRSQKGNFVALPTDCPQRDERLGWTGDIQVFCETACLNADSRTFLASWLKDLATEQRADGNVPGVVPNVIAGHEFEYGGVGWGDAATLVPWMLYMTYGDVEVLERQYPSMRAWVDYCTSRLNDQHVWIGDFQLGDWLDPGAPSDQPHRATTDSDLIATSYCSYSARRLGEAAHLLGRLEEAEAYLALSRRVAEAAWRRWWECAVTTQAGCAIVIMFDIAPTEELAEVGARLAGLVDANGGRIATGFLGTPLVLPALARTGQIGAAYRLLLNRDCPGWLYQIDRGATTMWERWDAVRADGSLHEGTMDNEDANSMTSFNHYAYGAVSAWLYRSVAGISADPAHPGFGRILFEPQPGGDLSWASAGLTTGYGDAAIKWELDADGLEAKLLVPAGATAVFRCPSGFALPDGQRSVEFGSGAHRLRARRMSNMPMHQAEWIG